MSVKLVEVYGSGTGTVQREYSLRTVYINPDHVVCIREDGGAATLLREGRLPADLDSRQQFTRVTVNKGTYGQDIIIVGVVEEIFKKLQAQKRQILRG